jgi:hypothetical protein
VKIYEIRDITDEETYYTKKLCATADEAIADLKAEAQDISDCPENGDYVIGAVYEHELGKWSHEEGFSKKIFEMQFENKYNEEKDDYSWIGKQTFPAHPELLEGKGGE